MANSELILTIQAILLKTAIIQTYMTVQCPCDCKRQIATGKVFFLLKTAS